MKIRKFKTEEEWYEARKGKITGSKLGGLFSKRDGKPLKSFYTLIKERIALPEGDENAMDRGKRLEQYAIERFEQETGKKVNADLVMWFRDDDENIAISPDGYIGKTQAVEVKCLNTESHIEAWMTGKIPTEYDAQVLQYFIVNDKLKTLYFVFYDPRMPKDFFYHTVERKDVEKDVERYLELERKALNQIREIEESLTF